MKPGDVLKRIYGKANGQKSKSFLSDRAIQKRVEYVCRCSSNRAGVRLLMACLLGKLHNPMVDPRKPYTEINSKDCFSGRTYDERYLTRFIADHRLPCNPTTAFLTPGLRNIDRPLTTKTQIIGRPRELYVVTLRLLDDVFRKRALPEALLAEAVRILISMRDEKLARIESLLDSLERGRGSLPLSSEAIVALIEQHLACKNASRVPALIVAAAYQVAGEKLGERVLPLNAHNAADLQTGSLGDIEVCLAGDGNVVTAYEMKMKKVTHDDIDTAINKITSAKTPVNNYIFITTDGIDAEVAGYAASYYEKSGGVEIAILDCVGFLRHFLHLFYRIRTEFLDMYQALVLAEPDSAISQTLKEAFLALRQAAETGE